MQNQLEFNNDQIQTSNELNNEINQDKIEENAVHISEQNIMMSSSEQNGQNINIQSSEVNEVLTSQEQYNPETQEIGGEGRAEVVEEHNLEIEGEAEGEGEQHEEIQQNHLDEEGNFV